MKKIKVLLVDDHMLMRQGLNSLLAREADIEVIGEAENGRQGLDLAKTLKPDVVVLDVAMPELNGMDTCGLMLKRQPELRVVALSMHSDARYVRRMVDAGASGYVLKNSAFKELAGAVRTVAKGRRYFGQGLSYESPKKTTRGLVTELTIREREVLQLIGEGVRTVEIGDHLGISAKTVETHRRRIMDKLGIDSLAGLIKYAIREGIVSLDV